MNASEAAIALGLCAAYDRRTVGEADARAWSEALPDIRLEDAKTAIVAHYRESREWIMPADITRHVKNLRLSRQAAYGARIPFPPSSVDPDEWWRVQTWDRAFRAAIGNGEDEKGAYAYACKVLDVEPEVEELTARPMTQLIEAAAKATTLPRKDS